MVQGTALSLALPTLELFTEGSALAQQPEGSRFFGLFFWANGTPWHAAHGPEQAAAGHPDLWTPSNTGAEYQASELLTPLSRHRVNVLTGLTPHTQIPPTPAGQGDGHMRGFMVALTGDRPQPETFDHSSHTLTALRPTLDQVVARHPDFYINQPLFRSLEVGLSEARFHGYGHWNAISYNGPNSQNLPLSDLGALYDRLFGMPIEDQSANKREVVLGAVLEEARAFRGYLGSEDRARLDAHIEHLDTLQRRLSSAQAACTPPERPSAGGDLIAKSRLSGELIAAALRCDLTRCFSLQLTSPATTHIFSNLNVPDGMHKTCHDGHWERVRVITRHQMEAFSAFLDPFQEEEVGGNSLLHRGLIYGTSEYGEGWKHSVAELPVIIAGRAGGVLSDHVHVRQSGGNISKAQLTALRAVGLSIEEFGWNGGETSETFGELFT